MKIISLLVATGLFAGCSGASTPTVTSGTTLPVAGSASLNIPAPASALQSFMRPRPAAWRLPPHTAWMIPQAKSQKLLYVSDYYGDDVFVFSYPKGKQVGLLTGFSFPSGLCVDKNANVWIADEFNSRLVEYAHGAKTPTAELSDAGWYPVGCSSDPTSGNLAVSNILSTASLPGSVGVYAKAAGKPKIYKSIDFYQVFFLSYDDSGTLWFDGQNQEQSFEYASLKGNKLTNLTLTGGSIQHAGDVDFVDGTITVGDQQGSGGYSIVYQTSGSQITGSTNLLGSSDISQYVVDGKRLIGVDAINDAVELWSYPAGGNIKRALAAPWTTPNGIALSPSE